jgi:hypothetical protein
MHEQAQQHLQEQRQQLQAAEEQLTAERQRVGAADGRILRSGIMLRSSLASFLMIVGPHSFFLVSPLPSGRDVVVLLLGDVCFWLLLSKCM